jgi:hypothetical protein
MAAEYKYMSRMQDAGQRHYENRKTAEAVGVTIPALSIKIPPIITTPACCCNEQTVKGPEANHTASCTQL